MRWIAVAFWIVGCAKDKSANDTDTAGDADTDTDSDADTTGSTGGGVTATGDWVGTCEFTDDTQDLHYDVEMDLDDAGGDVTGTLDLDITNSGYTGYPTFVFDLDGTRTGGQIDLAGIPHATNSTSATAIEVTGTISGDDLGAVIGAATTSTSGGYSIDIPCQLSR